MSKGKNVTNKLNITYGLFDIDEINKRLEELKNDKDNPIINYFTLEKATKGKIRRLKYQKNARFFTYIKFFVIDDILYGLVGGKTNYTSPDLDFSKDYGNSLTSFAKKLLSGNNFDWDETIVIINHESTANEHSDIEMALFLECILQREFNLFDS